MENLGRVRRFFYRDGVSLSEISGKTGYCRNTIKRWLKTAEGVEPIYRRQRLDTKVAPYAAQLIKAEVAPKIQTSFKETLNNSPCPEA